MTESPLKYLSEKKLSELKESIVANRDRYEAGNFLDLEHDNGWAVETSTVQVDHDLLAKLDGTARTAAADIDNSLILFQALQGMTPALAREERVWARLTHIECLGYSRERWLSGNKSEQLDAQVNEFLAGKDVKKVISVSDAVTTDDKGAAIGLVRVVTYTIREK